MKAIIMNHENGGSHVLDREGSFRFVKGYTSKPIGAEIELRQQPSFNTKIFAIAACVVVCVALGMFAFMWNTVTYSVYIDINPSVELVFNNFNRIKGANPLNDDGVALLSALKLKGSPGDAVVALIREAEAQGFLAGKGDSPAISITIVSKKDSVSLKCLDAIQVALSESGLNNIASITVRTSDAKPDHGANNGNNNPAQDSDADDPVNGDANDSVQTPPPSPVVTPPPSDTPDEKTPAQSPDEDDKDDEDDNDGVDGDDVDDVDGDDVDDANPNAGPGNNNGGSNNGGSNNGGSNNGGSNNGGSNNGGSNNGGSNNGGSNNGGDNNGGSNNGGSNNGGDNNGGGNNGGGNNGGGNNGGGNNGGGNNGGNNNGNGKP